MNNKEKYIIDAAGITSMQEFEGLHEVAWKSPSNIALIKYWGKKDDQIPVNPSLSFGLDKSFTKTTIQYGYNPKKQLELEFAFDGKENEPFKERILKYLGSITQYLPFLNSLSLNIKSNNSFPHSSGIASSASSMSALILGLCSIENDLFGTLGDEKKFYQKASFLSRLASGSAARSVYNNYVVWGKTDTVLNSTNELAIPLEAEIHDNFGNLGDAILITSSRKKSVSSSAGHLLMNNHPYLNARIKQVESNTKELIKSLTDGDESAFIEIIENEALSLHALMMSSEPGYNLLNDNTWKITDKIRNYRKKTGIFVGFTLDAGPNVHMIYRGNDREKMQDFIQTELLPFCENEMWIDDQMGNGPQRLV